MTQIKEDLKDHLIITTSQTWHSLLHKMDGSDPYSLYNFYLYTANWQKKHQIRCTTNYVSRGLSWAIPRVQRAKKQLIKGDFIEDVTIKDEQGQITGHFILLKHLLPDTTESTQYKIHGVDTVGPNTIIGIDKEKDIGIDKSIPIVSGGHELEDRPGRHWAVEFWNSIPPLEVIPPKNKFANPLTPQRIPRHRNPSTKTYQYAAKLLDQLHHGTFLNGRKKWARNLLEMFRHRGIPSKLLDMAWDRNMIHCGLRRLSKVFYLDVKVRSLDKLIYNPFTNPEYGYWSYFFDAYFNYPAIKRRIENAEDEPPDVFTINLPVTPQDLEAEGWTKEEIQEAIDQRQLLVSRGLD